MPDPPLKADTGASVEEVESSRGAATCFKNTVERDFRFGSLADVAAPRGWSAWCHKQTIHDGRGPLCIQRVVRLHGLICPKSFAQSQGIREGDFCHAVVASGESAGDQLLQPALTLEIEVRQHRTKHHQHNGKGIAENPAELGHVVKVHAIDRSNERGWEEHDRGH
jgi:hypothetical protein